jgi:hypothetical protein
VRGVLDIVSETTEQVVDRRRMSLLGELSARLQGAAGDVGDVGWVTVEVLGAARADICAADVHLRGGGGEGNGNGRVDDLLLLATTRARAGVGAVPPDVLRRVAETLQPAEHGRSVVAPLLIPGDPVAAGSSSWSRSRGGRWTTATATSWPWSSPPSVPASAPPSATCASWGSCAT